MNDYSHLFVCLMGMGTVFVGLICLIVLVTIMGKIVQRFDKPAVAAAASLPVPASDTKPEITGELVAAISAAIAENEGTDVSAIRILSIKKVS